ncbi:FAD-dependent oxidoreductase [Rhodococcus rhodnii]|uniref:Aromatic ring hydroxylase n=2 Tax=Rhodococcus rhodnii TaxID=38312 RepID=R7WPU3_9NOCA|nr:FAD-dependent monooxygenase [Rhodococcus rhodnii]EOM77332.1 aromatic ring hydroxylase [Rhodococcus rhodnii LMG 5362]TXG91709.1 FAD-dependent oxidoreductase [Rhodococcus rhodnii]
MSTYYQPCSYTPADFDSVTDSALPVVVVGAGPVGMAVALGLANRGIPVTVLEAADQVSFGSRAICISRHSLEVASRLGFGDELEELVLPWVGGRSFYRRHQVMEFTMRSGDTDVRGPMVNVSQSEFEQVMTDKLLAHPLVTLHWKSEVAGLMRDDDSVTVEITTEFGTRRLRAQWVVAADGGRSRMRELAGLRMQGTSYSGSYVIADIHWESELPAERMVWFDPPSNPGSTIIMHQQPRDIWRIDYQLDPSDDADLETQEPRIRERIARHLEWLGDDTPWTLEWHGFYRARALALDEFVHGRIVFAGDAAHLVPIFGVRGFNSGMEDAETLVWMLSAVVHGNADATLLAAYSAERHASWQQNVANAGKSTLVMSPGTDGYRATRDAVLALATSRTEFSHLIDPRQSSATHAHFSPLTVELDDVLPGLQPGDPVDDRRVVVRTAHGDVESTFGNARGSGFSLVGVGLSDAEASALVASAADLAARLAPESVTAVVVTDGACLPREGLAVIDDAQGWSASALGARRGEVFVIRPDGLVLTRTLDRDDLVAVADRVASVDAGSGRTARAGVPSGGDPAEVHREHVWLGLSDAIDQVDADDREGFFTRLALVLGSQVGRREFDEAIALASDPVPGELAETPSRLGETPGELVAD